MQREHKHSPRQSGTGKKGEDSHNNGGGDIPKQVKDIDVVE